MGFSKNTREEDTFDWCQIVSALVRAEFSLESSILDVGAGFGKYRLLLPEYPNMDAVEIWDPYIREEDLRLMYRQVYHADIMDFIHGPFWHPYDVVILGDVLEHISRPQAQHLVSYLSNSCWEVLAVVPYMYEQGPEHGNPYQAHQQADLTQDLMASAYPELSLVEVEEKKGQPYRGLYRLA